MSVILQAWCQIQRTSSTLRYVNCGPGHIECIYSSAYSDFNIHLNVSALLLEISRQFNERYSANIETNTAHILPFTLSELWFRLYAKYLQIRILRLQYSAAGIIATIVDITSINARYTANLMPNAAHILQFTLYDLWFRPYTKYLQLLIVRPQYSTERIWPAIGDIPTLRCALYCKHCAKCSPHPPVYGMWTVVRAINKVLIAPHIQTSIFIWTYLRCYCTYHDNSMRVTLQAWCQIQRTSSSLR
jgi:hypothetical protein